RHVHPDMPAELTLHAYPDRTFSGKVSYVDPLLDPKTRTVRVRLAVPNPTGVLRPEMFGDVVLHGSEREGLRVPADAVIESGTRSVVFVALGEGKFRPREVKLGHRLGDDVEVLAGLAAGENVVVGANFLLDSESRLRSTLQREGD
ncbi:MAG: efflux RND transporter periplasmic adaptor subunit, partial [Polyangiales bacterium]